MSDDRMPEGIHHKKKTTQNVQFGSASNLLQLVVNKVQCLIAEYIGVFYNTT